MSCGSVNDSIDESVVIPAAAGVEVFHTWTLVHDDLIDNDSMRRGKPSVHCEIEALCQNKLHFNESHAKEYGRSVAILAGDMMQAWSIKLFASLADNGFIDAAVALKLIMILETEIISNLIYGETLDVRYGYGFHEIEDLLKLKEDEIINMLWLKTGVLYSFSAMAGAMIGKNITDDKDPVVSALKGFASACGTAFQLQDDILGITGDEKLLGKPVGSDIREGKKTTILLEALRNASPQQRNYLSSVVGNRAAVPEDIEKTKSLLIELNGVDYTKQLARKFIKNAIPHLDIIKESQYKHLLLLWANYMIERDF